MATAGNFPFKAGSRGRAKHSGITLKIYEWYQEPLLSSARGVSYGNHNVAVKVNKKVASPFIRIWNSTWPVRSPCAAELTFFQQTDPVEG